MKIISGIILTIIVLGIAYGTWLIKRKVNYSFEYEKQITKTVKEITDPYEKRIFELETRISKLEQQNREQPFDKELIDIEYPQVKNNIKYVTL